MQRNRLAPLAQSSTPVVRLLSGVGFLGLGILLWLVFGAGAAAAAEQPTLNGRELSTAAGWHQRAVRRAVETSAPASQSRRAPAGWSAGAVRFGDGRALRDGSRRVKEVQRRLRVLGYHPGPVNGVYGERTRDAVGWFQYKHQLTLDGIVGLVTLRHIRAAQADALARPDQPAQARPDTRDAAAPVAPRRAADAPAPDTAATAASGFAGIAWWLWGLIAAGALALVALVAALLHRRRGRSVTDTAPVYELWVHGTSPDPAVGTFRGVVKAVSVPDEPRPAGWVADSQYLIHDPAKPEPFWASAEQIDELGAARQQPATTSTDEESAPIAIGYLSGPANGPTPSPQAGAIEAACQERGWRLAQIAHDPPAAGALDARPGLQHALHRLASGQATCLVIARLAHIGPSVEELAQMIARVEESRATLVVCDIDLDTSTTVGRRTANALATLNENPDPSNNALRALPSPAPAPAHH
jgi:peptidoglycan hydrolase-like protein with peptidoglycan-binding domain